VRAEFRANRMRERGGDQVAGWLLEIGSARLAPRDSLGTSAEWRQGDAVRLSLRWAADAFVRPSPAGMRPPAQVRDRAVSWTYHGDWALLRMIADLQGSPADLGGSPARARHTLALLVPTEAIVGDTITPAERARVFVRVRLRDPASGAERALPSFPSSAPALGAARGRGLDPDEVELDDTFPADDRRAGSAAGTPLAAGRP